MKPQRLLALALLIGLWLAATHSPVYGRGPLAPINDCIADVPESPVSAPSLAPRLLAPIIAESWTGEANQTNARFGQSVATAGDVNGDGYADVIVGAYLYDGGQRDEGRTYVYHGSATGLSLTPNWTVESNVTDAFFGRFVDTAGDVNGDGFDDVVIGAPSYTGVHTQEGRAYVYHGSAAGLSLTPNWIVSGGQADAILGRAVATAGDVNGDGFDDVIVGAHQYDNGEVDEGRAYVYLGSSSGLSTTPAWSFESNQAGAFLGWAVDTAGDVNDDGYDDIVVGARCYDNGQTDEGRAYLFLGSPGGPGLTPNWTFEADQESANFGRSVAMAGDVNGDGYGDVVIGSPSYSSGQVGEGRAYVFYGSTTGLNATPNWISEINQAKAHYGRRVDTAGDFNGDGYADVVIGAPDYSGDQSQEGGLFVYFGSASGLSATANAQMESDQTVAYLGRFVGSAGDVNGDGFADVIGGAPGYSNPEVAEGRAMLYLGFGQPVGTLSGVVTDASSGLPINGATVDTGGGFSDATDAGGFYQMVGVPVGTYTLTASKPGFTSVSAGGAAVTAGNTTTTNFALTPAGCVSACLRSTAIDTRTTVSGVSARVTVKNENGVAVASATVSATWTLPGGGTLTQTRTTNISGQAAFSTTGGAGTYTLTITNIVKTGNTFDPANSVLSNTFTK